MPFGPGFRIDIESSFIGPISAPHWEIDILTGDTEHVCYQWVAPAVFSPWHMVGQYLSPYAVQQPNTFATSGDTVTLRTRLVGSGGIVEESTQSQKLDEVQGRMWELANLIGLVQTQVDSIAGQITPVAESPWTAEDRATLVGISASTSVPMGISGDVQNIPIAGFITRPPVGFLKVGPLFLTATGNGTIDGDDGLLPTLFGLWWEFSAVPEGYGQDIGAVPEFELRMLQLRTIYSLNGVDFVRDYQDFNVERVLWFWQEAKPSRVEYSIGPGVEVQFHYIQWISL